MNGKIMKLLLPVSFLLIALVAGCGTSNKEGSALSSLDSVGKVGDTPCFQCHAATADPLTGETFIEQYKRSLHAELGCESCHGGGAQHNGVGPFPFVLNSKTSDAKKAERCVQCHDGVTQVTTLNGQIVVAPLSSSPNFQNGNHANPFSAEEAHEAKCARCHSHEGSILYGREGFTGDASILNNTAFQPVLGRDPETFNTIRCATCHEHGGNVRQTKTRDANGNVVTWDPDGNKVISQFDLCTSCHTMNTNSNGKLIGSGAVLQIFTSASAGSGFKNVSTAAFFHNTRWFRTLPSTHYDQPASRTTASGTLIEGYVIRKNVKNPCYECHGHEFKANTRALVDKPERGTTNFTDWAQSAHAGKILSLKLAAANANAPAASLTGQALTTAQKAQVDAVMTAGVKDVPGKFSAWGHYNWDNSTGNPSTSADPDRKVCQRCHTATGASNFMKNPPSYDPANNDFSHLAGKSAGVAWGIDPATGRTSNAFKTSPQNELLYCWGCHANPGTGKLYAPGARTETYAAVVSTSTGTIGSTVTVAYPDIAGSNVCMTCHVGREIGDNIKALTDADGVLSFVNSHYLTAGATLFARSGYTYAGRDYANPAFFLHDKVGTPGAPGTGTNGPCVGCHMTSPNKHRFTNVSTSGGSIVKLTSTQCANCHTGLSAMTAETLNTEEEEYQAALTALKTVLQGKGVFFNGSKNPYFFTDGTFATNYTNWAAPYGAANFKDTMGAAFNLNLLAHDPGGFVHNRFYAKRLIWDSIDYIDDGTLNNSVPATLTAALPAGQTLTDAQAYLGSTRP